MIICKNENMCTGCTLCVQICKHGAIRMVENEEGFLYPEIDEEKCINCGLCVRKCPANCEPNTCEAAFYMGWHRNKEILVSSSSGGVFSAIADYVFQRDGVVFGAEKNSETGELIHQIATNESELKNLRGSKYYQSRMDNVYSLVREKLLANKHVLFSGTACQIAALYSYLGNIDYDKLITVDVLCHGVANKKVIDAYIMSQEKRFAKKIVNYSFRVKEGKYGWNDGNGTRMKLFFSDGTSTVMEAPYDTFFLGFNHNYFLRESCYKCKYCGTERVADFTLGDFWGCAPEKASPKQLWLGISLVLVNTNKANSVLADLSENVELTPIDKKEAILHNRALFSPQERPAYRNEFFDCMERDGFERSIKNKFRMRFIKYRVKIILKALLPRKIATKIMKNV